jgi:hypothetical protein
MKHILLLLALLIFFTCKEKEEIPPVIPDYADSIVGTYLGGEVKKEADNWTVEYSNSSKTMKVVKLGKNRVQLDSFNVNFSPIFTLSDGGMHQGNQIITLTPEGYTGSGSRYLSKQLSIRLTIGSGSYTRYYYYDGTKQ